MWSKVIFFITIKCPSTIKLFSKENDITNWYETWSFVIQEVVIFCHFMSCPTILSGNTSVVHLLIWMLCRHRWQYNLDYKLTETKKCEKPMKLNYVRYVMDTEDKKTCSKINLHVVISSH